MHQVLRRGWGRGARNGENQDLRIWRRPPRGLVDSAITVPRAPRSLLTRTTVPCHFFRCLKVETIECQSQAARRGRDDKDCQSRSCRPRVEQELPRHTFGLSRHISGFAPPPNTSEGDFVHASHRHTVTACTGQQSAFPPSTAYFFVIENFQRHEQTDQQTNQQTIPTTTSSWSLSAQTAPRHPPLARWGGGRGSYLLPASAI